MRNLISILIVCLVSSFLIAAPVLPRKKEIKKVYKAPVEKVKRHPTIFVGIWNMEFGEQFYITTLTKDGKYTAVLENTETIWKGTWWIDKNNRFWIYEELVGYSSTLEWGFVPSTTFDGKIDSGNLLGVKISFTKRKPDA